MSFYVLASKTKAVCKSWMNRVKKGLFHLPCTNFYSLDSSLVAIKGQMYNTNCPQNDGTFIYPLSTGQTTHVHAKWIYHHLHVKQVLACWLFYYLLGTVGAHESNQVLIFFKIGIDNRALRDIWLQKANQDIFDYPALSNETLT